MVENGHPFPQGKKWVFFKKRQGNDFLETGSCFLHLSTSQNRWKTWSYRKNDLVVARMRDCGVSLLALPYLALQNLRGTTQSLLMLKNYFSIHTDQSICLFHRSSIFQNQIWVWHMLSMISIDFMIAIAQKTGYCGGKTKKINENVARVCYKRISNCTIRRANLFTD